MFIDNLEQKLIADGKCFVYRDIEVSMPEISKHYILPAVIISKNGVIVFVNTKEYGPLNKLSGKCSNIVSYLRSRLAVHYVDITMFVTEKNTRHLKVDFSGNYAEDVNEAYIEEVVLRIINSDGCKFDDAKYKQLETVMDKLNTKQTGKVLQTQFDEEGNEYVWRDEKWVQYIDEDPDEAFRNLLYFGLFGSRMFKEKKFFQGMFYAMSAGGFGAFWFMDCLQMLFGCRRVKKHNIFKGASTDMIYRPIVNKKDAWIRFAAFLPVVGLFVFCYTKFLAWFLGLVLPQLAEIAQDIADKQTGAPGGLEDLINSGG